MRSISVKVEGLSPLLMHRFPMEPIQALEKKTPKEQAQIALYEEEGKPFIPAVCMLRALVNGAVYSKGKGRASLQKVVLAGLFIDEHSLPLNGKTTEWVVDAQPVVVPATKGRVVRYRPRFDHWETKFTITYDENLLMASQVRTIVDDTGTRVGILDFRPEKKGPFGRFTVTAWDAD